MRSTARTSREYPLLKRVAGLPLALLLVFVIHWAVFGVFVSVKPQPHRGFFRTWSNARTLADKVDQMRRDGVWDYSGALPESDDILARVEEELGFPLSDSFGRRFTIVIPADTDAASAAWQPISVIASGSNGIYEGGRNDDIVWRAGNDPLKFDAAVQDGAYWKVHRYLSPSVAGTAALSALWGLWALFSRRKCWQMQVWVGFALFASAGWLWDGPAWNRNWQLWPGAVVAYWATYSLVAAIAWRLTRRAMRAWTAPADHAYW